SVLSYVTRTGNRHALAFKRHAAALQHVFGKIDQSVPGRLGTNQTTAERETLASKNAAGCIGKALEHTRHVAHLACAYADIPGGYISIGAYVTKQLEYQGLAKTPNFPVRLAFGIEIGTALATA